MILTTATLAEAKPLIAALKLEKVKTKPFPIYQKDHLLLILTGIGPINAAAALGYIVTQPTQILNVGICAGTSIGSIQNIYKVIDDASNKSYLLQKDPSMHNAALRTLYHPALKKYKELVDMESSALVVTAKRFSCPIKIIKIVSDRFDPKSVTPKSTQELIEHRIDTILDIMANLKKDFQ